MDSIKEVALDEVISEHFYEGKTGAEVFDFISDGKACEDNIVVLNEHDHLIDLKQIQEKLAEVFQVHSFTVQQAFDVVIPKDIQLQKSDHSLIADFSMADMLEGESIDARATLSSHGVMVGFDGFGTHTEADGLESTPLLVEKAGGVVRVVAWNDINQEDFTDTLELADGARLENRVTNDFKPS